MTQILSLFKQALSTSKNQTFWKPNLDLILKICYKHVKFHELLYVSIHVMLRLIEKHALFTKVRLKLVVSLNEDINREYIRPIFQGDVSAKYSIS